jgi:hypothetical protein
MVNNLTDNTALDLSNYLWFNCCRENMEGRRHTAITDASSKKSREALIASMSPEYR